MAQAITTKYAGPTNTLGSRIIVTSWIGRTVLSWDHSLNSKENHLAAINGHIERALCNNYKWRVLAVGEAADGSGKVAIIETVNDEAGQEPVSAQEWDAKHYA